MTVEALLRALVAALRADAIPFTLTGSVAGAYHGAGRATMDIDLVIDPGRDQLDSFVARMLALGVYVSDEAARDALARRSMFSVVDPESGWKADLIVRKRRPFSEEEFRRRQPADFLDIPVEVATVNDLMLSKLEWAKQGGSARQPDDVRALLRLTGDELDREYLARWVEALGLGAEWLAVSRQER